MAASHLRSDRWRLMVVGASVVLAAVVLPSCAGATPSYQGGASAGWAYQEGDVLIAHPGEWTSTTSITYTYAWFNENSLALGTGPTYTVAGKDVGHQIYAAITATDGVAPSSTVNTPTTGPMRYRPPVNLEQPTVRGALLEGSTLTAGSGKRASAGPRRHPSRSGTSGIAVATVGAKPDCSNSGYIGPHAARSFSRALTSVAGALTQCGGCLPGRCRGAGERLGVARQPRACHQFLDQGRSHAYRDDGLDRGCTWGRDGRVLGKRSPVDGTTC